mmetsp:Transcript_21725/g.45266  ORF Transcript_21725/g.45266 Transcript_21725/m.45266 type:complete len:435 (+) Transcript_21725:36-1340(+)
MRSTHDDASFPHPLAVDEEAVRLTIVTQGAHSGIENPSSCCQCCITPCLSQCMGSPVRAAEWCVSPLFYAQCVGLFLFSVVVINFLCPQATFSPLYNHTGSLPSVPLFITFVLVFVVLLFCREVVGVAKTDRRSASVRFAKKGAVFTLIYLLILPVAYWSANISLYHDGEETPDGVGTEFTFMASSNTELKAYLKTFFSSSASSVDADSVAHYPIVYLGGTGINMYGNIHRVKDFLYPTLSSVDEPIAFDVYTFSYRGYLPNNHHTPTERNIIDDSVALWNYAKSLYPENVKPLLFSHSLGTGPTSALLEKFGGSDSGPACAGLAMPYSSMSQCISELGFYTPLLFLYLVDSWRSQSRVKNMHPDVPLAILSAANDELIAPHHQTSIYNSANAKMKYLLYSSVADHNDLSTPIYQHLDTYLGFMESCLARTDVT